MLTFSLLVCCFCARQDYEEALLTSNKVYSDARKKILSSEEQSQLYEVIEPRVVNKVNL